MNWYIITFKYGGNWGMTLTQREEPYQQDAPKDKEWLKECVVKALSDQELRKEEKNLVNQVLLHEIRCDEKPKDEAFPARIINPPAGALEHVDITLYK